MKRVIFFLAVVLSASLIFFEGNTTEENKVKKQTTNEVIRLLKTNYEDIEEITITNYETLPTNVVAVEGHLNNNKDKFFSVTYNSSTKSPSDMIVSAKQRPECLDKICK
ncbi:DUF1433 domain-containing protein [Metabacillus indicus]|uniref:DUF1433 domain-containing protein n=1 Tax=Metabacillus indicus TaxID=246786 RepID=UPI003CE70CB0